MKVYCVFDDFPQEARNILIDSGIDLKVLPSGKERPKGNDLKKLLDEYDGLILGTGQKIEESFFENITSQKIIATASSGTDHIKIPKEKSHLVKIFNTPTANTLSVCEYIFAVLLNRFHKIEDGYAYYRQIENSERKKPSEVYKKTVGIIGAGNIGGVLADMLKKHGVRVLQWTKHPERHHSESTFNSIKNFVSLDYLCKKSDAVCVCIPSMPDSRNFFSELLTNSLKSDCIFVGISRAEVYDIPALVKKAASNLNFSLCLDIDYDAELAKVTKDMSNVFITPHIAGGTVESRKRMFIECAKNIVKEKLQQHQAKIIN